ncbi:hypothetical protein MmTuc01_2570 [Methanosarcina mazei Tuc01]|uniref:Uncharacterized protein n=1 Tax=Methanosarcina mazei Tuc01 TaxID=1236903 RepID=M1PBG0_METMZ|nr:hypothetical protein MmTuc01_2570 [Methanosarcina mazei Tuc01]
MKAELCSGKILRQENHFIFAFISCCFIDFLHLFFLQDNSL